VGQGGALDEEGAVRDGVHALELLDVHVEAALEEVAVVPQQEAAQRGGRGGGVTGRNQGNPRLKEVAVLYIAGPQQ
jgi:hypothetical protein